MRHLVISSDISSYIVLLFGKYWVVLPILRQSPQKSSNYICYLCVCVFQALLQKESQEFPVLNNLTNLHLEECDVGVNYQVLTSILRNTPNMEKLALHRCTVRNMHA